MARPLRRDDYTVGWVCALPIELAAAQEMLDEEHPNLERDPDDNDENLYALGSICGHNVVIVCLPAGRIGNNPAASVTTQLRATFKKIRFGLMVGIGGGVPSDEADIRLGDVVVSQPHGTFAGVVQYDAGKATTSGFERTGSLNSPPQILLSAVSRVRANELRGRSKLCKHIESLEGNRRFQRSKAGPDVLFEASYDHEGGQTCDKCCSDRQKDREPRDEDEEVAAHYGTVASGNQVIKNAVTRDRLSRELGGVLCFEMEAAGLMNSFPCLVVRGVCDYADSHKNKKWQPFAAGTAAAYAKELLSMIPPADVAKSRTAEEAMRDAVAKPKYYIPFLKNRKFVGRRDELAELRQRLLVAQDCQKMTILGLGGTGKTQVALQFAYEVKEIQPDWSIFWVAAVSMETFEQACAGIVAAFGIPEGGDEKNPKELMKQYLSSEATSRWLVVVDNADDPDVLFGSEQSQGIVDYLPTSEQGIVLYTTRTPEVAELTPGDVIELSDMSRVDAIDFLTRSLARKGNLSDDTTTTELLDELTCLPLAIAQAAAYLNRNRLSIPKYLQLLRSTEQDLVHMMSREFRDDTRYKGSKNAVATTWVVSLDQIRKHDAMAAKLLSFISCIEWKAIPRSLLPSMGSDAQTEEAIGALCGYSFLTRRANHVPTPGSESTHPAGINDEELFDIHRLVHLATRVWISERDNPAEVTEWAMREVADIFPLSNYENRYWWRTYMPHALRLLKTEQDCGIASKSRLCMRVGRCFHTDGRFEESIKWLEECCHLRNVLNKDDADLLSAQHLLASSYQDNGQTKQALRLLETVVEVENKTLKADDPNRLASQHELARAYLTDGQTNKAVALLEAVVKAEETLAADDPGRLTSQQVLAEAYERSGQIRKAMELGERVLKAREGLASDHPELLASKQVLAAVYLADAQSEKAVALLEAVAKEQETLQLDHPWRLSSQHELARAYLVDSQVEKAIDQLEAVVEIESRVLAADHRDRLASQHMLARAYLEDGQVEKAIEQLEAVVEIQTRVLAAGHPNWLTSQHELARAYYKDGQLQRAIELLEIVVETRSRVLRADHPDTLESEDMLAQLRAGLAVELNEAFSESSRYSTISDKAWSASLGGTTLEGLPHDAV
ncbi:hypothetical protein E8E13_001284 [Curvularia kusanoi]|uniref:Kinesin light chain n=1 Tax=Curvularia kusanoi TaxID=90978 RepID=A0A9P4W607_CURKU|nr:hypothetical protein E8E13_001284 [Curvularia kusanoi]